MVVLRRERPVEQQPCPTLLCAPYILMDVMPQQRSDFRFASVEHLAEAIYIILVPRIDPMLAVRHHVRGSWLVMFGLDAHV